MNAPIKQEVEVLAVGWVTPEDETPEEAALRLFPDRSAWGTHPTAGSLRERWVRAMRYLADPAPTGLRLGHLLGKPRVFHWKERKS